MKDNSKKGQRVIIVGGGAAGFFCAVNLARMAPNLEVIILEKSAKFLSKVRVSGGGRCNVTHACDDIAEMSRCYPRGQHFVKKSFHAFFVKDTIAWFEQRGVKLKTEADGRMFPVTDNSETIIRCLLDEASRYHVDVRLQQTVIEIEKKEDRFYLKLQSGDTLTTDYVCVAAGGFPKLQQFEWLQKLGHSIESPVPSLFSFNLPGHDITRLQGVSFDDIHISIVGTKIQTNGPALVTHWGLSGPAVLKASAWGARVLAEKNWEFQALVKWIPEHNEQSLYQFFQDWRKDHSKRMVSSKNPFALPQRFWEYLLQRGDIRFDINWADLTAKEMQRLAKQLCAFELNVRGKTTFKEEFVTAGGIRLSEVDPQTMQSRKYGGLFFAGELLDVDGITGGYNFQHAWTSGMLAARAIAAI